MDDAVEDGAQEADRLIEHTDRGLSEVERNELRRIGDKQFRKYFAGGLFFGVAADAVAMCRYGAPWGQTDIAAVSSLLGAMAGTILNGIGLYVVGVLFFTEASGVTEVLHMAWLFCWAAVVCQFTVLYIVVHRRHIEIIDPGPPHQIFGIYGFFAAQLLLKNGHLFDPATLQTRQYPVHSRALRYAGKDNIQKVCQRINKVYYTLGVAPCVMALLVLVLICATLILWKHVSKSDRSGFDTVDLAAPGLLIGSFILVHLIFCFKADRILKEVNDEEDMVRKNIAWVLHRTPVTHSYCLWLVWRNPEAYALTRCGGVRWWERYAVGLPSFKLTVRVFLLIQRRLAPADAAWLNGDLVFLVLSYLAEGNQQAILKATRRRRLRAVLL